MRENTTFTTSTLLGPIVLFLLCATPGLAEARAPAPQTPDTDATREAEAGEPPDKDEPDDTTPEDEPDDTMPDDADETPDEDATSQEDDDTTPADEPDDEKTPPADETSPPPKVTVEKSRTRARRQRGDDPVLGPMLTRQYIDGMNRRARGVGLGYDSGVWGSGFMQGLKVDIPFGRRVGQFFGLRVRGSFVHTTKDAYDPVINSGLEIFGRGPVFFGIVRMYGGGGGWIGIRPVPTEEGGTWAITGGGHLGFELFYVRRSSFTFEFGGQGSGHHLDLDAGASVVAGVTLYLGDIRKRR